MTPEPVKRSRAQVRAAYRSQIWLSDTPKPCDGRPDEYVDFVVPPSRAEAAALCAGCPFAALCLEFGRVDKGDGVYGGEVLKDGRRINWAAPRSAVVASGKLAS